MKLLMATVLVLMCATAIAAHPGHGEVKVLSGRLVAVQVGKIQIEFFDRSSFSTKLSWVLVDDKTKVTAGKTRLTLADLKLHQEIDCMAEIEEGKDGTTALRAVQIRLKKAK